jgi:hypothetical protein
LTTTKFALTLNSEVGILMWTNLLVHGKLVLKFVSHFQFPLVLDYLEQTAVVKVIMTTKRLKGALNLEET